MPKGTPPEKRGPASKRGDRYRECTYLLAHEAEQLHQQAELEDTSRAEILRRALRLYIAEYGEE